jgi:MFS superfamily sulfate permease-like transporter
VTRHRRVFSLDGMQQRYIFRRVVRWLVAIIAATFIAAIPTRLSSHDSAAGFPFTWYNIQGIFTLGEYALSFSLWLLLLDIALVLAAFVVLRIVISKLIHRRGKDASVTNHAV